MSSFSVFFRSAFEVQSACMVLIRISFEHRTCKRVWVVFSICSQPVLFGVQFHSAPGLYIHGNAWIDGEVSGSFLKVLQSLTWWLVYKRRVVATEITLVPVHSPVLECSVTSKAWFLSSRPGSINNTRSEGKFVWEDFILSHLFFNTCII